jgi:hypothetical protein
MLMDCQDITAQTRLITAFDGFLDEASLIPSVRE